MDYVIEIQDDTIEENSSCMIITLGILILLLGVLVYVSIFLL